MDFRSGPKNIMPTYIFLFIREPFQEKHFDLCLILSIYESLNPGTWSHRTYHNVHSFLFNDLVNYQSCVWKKRFGVALCVYKNAFVHVLIDLKTKKRFWASFEFSQYQY